MCRRVADDLEPVRDPAGQEDERPGAHDPLPVRAVEPHLTIDEVELLVLVVMHVPGGSQTRIHDLLDDRQRPVRVLRGRSDRCAPTEEPRLAGVFGACTGLYNERNPAPDLTQWLAEPDPITRLERGLRETYAYHCRTEKMMSVAEREVVTNPVLATLLEPMEEYWRQARDALTAGWGEPGSPRDEVAATIALAVALSTWKLLTGPQGLSDEQCVRLFLRSVQAQAHHPADSHRSSAVT